MRELATATRHRDYVKVAWIAGAAMVIGVGAGVLTWPNESAPEDVRDGAQMGKSSKRGIPALDETSGDVDSLELVYDPGCRLHRGSGAAEDAAAAVQGSGRHSRFVVVDGSGVVFAGGLPFLVDRVRLGRREDGALVAAFFGTRDGRLVALLNGQVLTDGRGVADFGLSRDGAEWFAVRRLGAEEGFRVEQHDTASGAVRSFTTTQMRATDTGLSHAGAYSPVENAPIFEPLQPGDSYDNSFIMRSMEGNTRLVRLRAVQAIVESNAHIYVLQRWRTGHRVAKQAFRWRAQGDERLVDVWSHTLRVAPATVRMFLSDDAAWLGLLGWRLAVLNAATGEQVFSFPVRGERAAELARLRSVMAPDATVADVGQAASARIAHGLLLVSRTLPAPGATADGQSGGESLQVVDVFRMDGLLLDSGPDARLAAEDLHRCLADAPDFPLPAVRIVGDGLAYGHQPKQAGGFRAVR